jgi:hypothetical protein
MITSIPAPQISFGIKLQVTHGRNQIQMASGSYSALYMGADPRIAEFYVELKPGESYVSNTSEAVANLVVSTSSPLAFVGQAISGEINAVVSRMLCLDNPLTGFTLTNNSSSTVARVYINTMSTKIPQATLYWGPAVEPSVYDADFIRSLSNGSNGNKDQTITVNAGAGENIYYCYPVSLGASQFSVNGFIGGIVLVATVNMTMDDNSVVPFYVYGSENSGLGLTTVTVLGA